MSTVDLREERRRRWLDELAGIAHAGVDVPRMLEDEVAKQPMTEPVSLRLHTDSVAEAERLVEALADTPEARFAGGKWSRAAVIRWAVELGLAELARREKRMRG